MPSIRIGEVCLAARQPLGRETWTRLGVSFADGKLGLQVAGELVAAGPAGLGAPHRPGDAGRVRRRR